MLNDAVSSNLSEPDKNKHPHANLDIWQQACLQLRSLLDEYSYKNWIEQTNFHSYENGELKIDVPSPFFADWMRDHFNDAVQSAVRHILPDMRTITYVVSESAAPPPQEEEHIHLPHVSRKMTEKVHQSYNGFNPRYVFEQFVIGAGNRFAHAAARAVADSPGRAYNPLFLYGDTGLGKTHLMQAIGQSLLKRSAEARVIFISSEQFTNQLIQSIADKSTQRFRQRYRKADVILIDDIQFITGKEATQEEFFHTFNTLFDAHKQIVISSDRSPKELRGVETRLVSRFEWGLVTDIQPPDLETRVAILRNKARTESLVVPEDVIRYIATYITSNIRELEGALVTVLAYSRLTTAKISLAMAEEVLRDLVGADKIKPITFEQIQRAVAEFYDVRIADLRGRSRQRQIVRPRQMAMYLCKELIPSLSLNDIGEAFGGKDHTTIIYACNKVAKDLEADPELRQAREKLLKLIRG